MDTRHVLLNTLVVAGVLVGLYLVYLVRNVLFVLFLAILLATAMAPLVDRMRSRIGIGQAVLSIYLGFGLCLSVLGYLVLQLLLEQVSTLSENLPGILGSLQAYAGAIEMPFLRQMLLDLLSEVSATLSISQSGTSGGLAQGVVTITASLVTILVGFFAVMVIAYYWIVERAAIMRFFLSFFPHENRPKAYAVWHAIEARLGGWVRGQLMLMGIIAVLFGAGYAVMGVKYALLLAVFAGVTELIPLIGPWLGAAPAVLVAITQDFWLAVAVVVYSVIVQTVEGNIFVPRVLGGTIGMSPIVVLLAVLVGLALMGPLGGLLAVPIASALQVIVQALFLQPDSPAHLTTSAAGTTTQKFEGKR